MANSEIGSCTRDTLGGEYQVFLSYRTHDTGPGFTDSLYHALVDAGIHVFLDNEEIRPGQSLTSKLLQALNDSKIYIPIFSNSYASSHWCLTEFAKMVENTSKPQGGNMKVIFPVYYDVTPYDVKLETELYIEAITELEKQMEEDQKKFRTEEVEKWRRALREFNDTKGLDLRDFKGDGHLSKSVVEEVVKRLWIKQRIVTKDLVGMEDRIEIINNLLNTGFGGEYQVYLSYSGFDTHRKFSNTLYHALVEAGIRVVTDYEELQEYGSAIDDSKIYIIIFSQMYLSNRWCLHQLVRMVENTSKSKEDGDRKLMLPIFYDAKLKDVQLKTKLYDDAILELEQINNSTEAKMWLQALKEDGGISGLNLKNYTGDGDLSKSVVNKVVDRLRKERSKDVQLVGIYGMTGIGKSTLAKIIFNQQYPHFGKYCSFLDDVSKTAKTKGLVELQKQLLSDISNSRVARNIEKIDHGIHMIGETICSKKVLIVLDDVDDVNQIQELIALNSLCPGTRILVTTRDKTVLKIRGFKYEIVPYEMEGLSDEDALQLFSRHAFDSYPPPDNYDALSKGIVSTAGGLPLALEAIGSSLFLQKDKKIWEEKLEKLRKTPNRNVLGNLRISYDALEMDQRQIFLDIACFFIDENKTNPIYMWRDCGFSPKDAIDILISRCMIKVINNKFRMHNQFRDFGRAIANQEHSRLWATYDIISELISTEIKGSVQALCLQMDLSTQPPITVTWEQIQRFPHLRFLRCSNVTFQGKFTGCLSKLKWFSYRYPGIYPSLQGQRHPRFEATNLHLENVHVVNLFGLGFIDDEVSSLIKGASKLKVLTLQESDLQTLEGLPSNLTVLELSRTRVKQVPLDGLAQLEKLTIEGCGLLERLSIPSNLRKLREVKVSSCTELVEVQFLDVLRSMEILCIEDCKSFERLKNLKKLKNLKDLSIKGCEILQVIEGIDELEFLQRLKVKGCGSIRRIIDASSSTIPNECEISITDCGELLDTGRDGSSTTWESYSEKILKRPIQGSDSKTEAGDPLLKTNQQNKEEKKYTNQERENL